MVYHYIKCCTTGRSRNKNKNIRFLKCSQCSRHKNHVWEQIEIRKPLILLGLRKGVPTVPTVPRFYMLYIYKYINVFAYVSVSSFFSRVEKKCGNSGNSGNESQKT